MCSSSVVRSRHSLCRQKSALAVDAIVMQLTPGFLTDACTSEASAVPQSFFQPAQPRALGLHSLQWPQFGLQHAVAHWLPPQTRLHVARREDGGALSPLFPRLRLGVDTRQPHLEFFEQVGMLQAASLDHVVVLPMCFRRDLVAGTASWMSVSAHRASISNPRFQASLFALVILQTTPSSADSPHH